MSINKTIDQIVEAFIPEMAKISKTNESEEQKERHYNHRGQTCTDGERSTPKIARRKPRTCSLRAHSNTWRPVGVALAEQAERIDREKFPVRDEKITARSPNRARRRHLGVSPHHHGAAA